VSRPGTTIIQFYFIVQRSYPVTAKFSLGIFGVVSTYYVLSARKYFSYFLYYLFDFYFVFAVVLNPSDVIFDLRIIPQEFCLSIHKACFNIDLLKIKSRLNYTVHVLTFILAFCIKRSA